MAQAIILSVIGSGALFSFLTFLITRYDNKKKDEAKQNSEIAELNKRLLKTERDAIRTQLLLLLSDYSDNDSEILQVGEYYFKELKGDWYMSSLFHKHLIKRGIAKPSWFNEEG